MLNGRVAWESVPGVSWLMSRIPTRFDPWLPTYPTSRFKLGAKAC